MTVIHTLEHVPDPVDIRTDAGALWENFLFIERMKLFANAGKSVAFNFWRRYSGTEVDYIEKATSMELKAFEFKYSKGPKSRGASSFTSDYGTEVKLINQENYLEFLTKYLT